MCSSPHDSLFYCYKQSKKSCCIFFFLENNLISFSGWKVNNFLDITDYGIFIQNIRFIFFLPGWFLVHTENIFIEILWRWDCSLPFYHDQNYLFSQSKTSKQNPKFCCFVYYLLFLPFISVVKYVASCQHYCGSVPYEC